MNSLITIREEEMSSSFMKYHIDRLPFDAVIHRFTQPDHGYPHNHPWDFTSFIMKGGYVEELYNPDGTYQTITRFPHDVVQVYRKTIHRIIELPAGEAWTLILPNWVAHYPWTFHRWIDGIHHYREPGKEEWLF